MSDIFLYSETQNIVVDGAVTLSEIVIDSETQHIVVNESNGAISIISAGPQGPAGPPGTAAPLNFYFHTQAFAASSWVINHNLGFRPNVSVEEAGTGYGIMAAEIHHTVNQVELQFNTPRAGTARLS